MITCQEHINTNLCCLSQWHISILHSKNIQSHALCFLRAKTYFLADNKTKWRVFECWRRVYSHAVFFLHLITTSATFPLPESKESSRLSLWTLEGNYLGQGFPTRFDGVAKLFRPYIKRAVELPCFTHTCASQSLDYNI